MLVRHIHVPQLARHVQIRLLVRRRAAVSETADLSTILLRLPRA